MWLPRVRFTVRQLMAVVAVLAVFIAASRGIWELQSERAAAADRLVRRQNLVKAIGPANHAVGPTSFSGATSIRLEPVPESLFLEALHEEVNRLKKEDPDAGFVKEIEREVIRYEERLSKSDPPKPLSGSRKP